MRASFEVSQLRTKTRKPHKIAEELILPAANITFFFALINKKAAKDFSFIHLSNYTVKKKTDGLSNNNN